jgi:integrase
VIHKRGKVCFYNFRWTIRNADGTVENFRIRRSAKTANRNEARDVEAEHRRALRLGEVHPLDPWPKPTLRVVAPTLRVFALSFLSHTQVHTKPGTHMFYEDCLDRLLAFAALADVPMNEISGEIVSRYASYRTEIADNSNWTVNGDLRTLRRMLHLAVEWGKLKHAIPIHLLPECEGRTRVLSFAEEARYLAAASPNLRDAAVVAVDTGIRPDGELLVLCWPNVDLTSQPECPHGVIHICKGKSKAARRSIPLTQRAAQVLSRRKKDAQAKPSAYLFPGAGNSGHIVSLQHPHEHAIEKAKLEPFEFYCWRHTFRTRAAQAGMDRYSLARLMGHSSPAITERYYVHVTEEHVGAGFERFAEYQARGVAKGIADAFPEVSDAVQ